MTELSFLLDLLLNHKLPKVTKELIVERVREVEKKIDSAESRTVYLQPQQAKIQLPSGTVQSPSTLALMAKHGDIPPNISGMIADIPLPPPPVPVEQIAQTAATQAAMVAREAAMQGRKSEQIMTGKGIQGPRKW